MVLLTNLPTDGSQISAQEVEILEKLFKNDAVGNKVKSEFKDVLIATIIFAFISLKIVSQTIKKIIPVAENQFMLIFVKSLLFFAIFYLIKKLLKVA